MAYGKPNTKGELSAFNEGAGQMDRLNRLQDRINTCNAAPLFKDIETGKYFYEIKFESLNSLFAEGSSKFSDVEIEEGKKIREIIRLFLKLKPVFFIKTVEFNGQKRRILSQNNKNWEELEQLLFIYEIKIRKFLENHNLTAPKSDDPSRAAFG